MTAASGIGVPPRLRGSPGRGIGPAVGKRGRRALIAFATLATALWVVGSAAADPVERVISLLSQEKYFEARATLEPLLQGEPDAPRLRLLHGILRAREGRPGEAIIIFERLRNDRPDMFEPYNNLAVLYAEQGRIDDARDVLLAALERRPDAVAYANLGDVYTRLADRAYSRARDIGRADGRTSQRNRLRRPAPPTSAKPFEGPAPPDPAPAAVEAPAPRAKPAAPGTANDGPLALVEDPGDTEATEASGAAPAGASGGACVQAGRFKDQRALAVAVEWLLGEGAEVIDLRQKDDRVVKSYTVYLPALPSAQEAAAKLHELRGQGIRDVALIRNGARANRISLGVFRSKSNSERRVAQLRKLGYPAERAVNTRVSGEHAVRARPGGTPSALASAWASKFPGQPIGVIDCP